MTTLQQIHGIVQFINAGRLAWSNRTTPVPDGLFVIEMDTGDVRLGDNVTQYADLPVQLNVRDVVNLTKKAALIDGVRKGIYTWLGTAGGTSTALTATLGNEDEVPLDAYIDGMVVRFRAAATNTAAATLNINGLGARAIVRADGTAISGGALQSGRLYQMTYSAAGAGSWVLGQDLTDAVVRPSDFGAVGDGVTDDTVALQTAANSAYARKMTLDLGNKTYMTNGLDIIAPFHMVGDDRQSAAIKLNANANRSVIRIGCVGSSTNIQHVFGEGFYVNGNKSQQSATTHCHGIEFVDRDTTPANWTGPTLPTYGTYVWTGVFQFVGATNCVNDGWYLGKGRNSLTSYNCNGSKCGEHGWHLWSMMDGTLINPTANGNGASGMVISGCIYLRIRGGSFWSNGAAGVFAAGNDLFFQNTRFDRNQTNGLVLKGAGKPGQLRSVVACSFGGNSRAGDGMYADILISGKQRVSIVNPQFLANSADIKSSYGIETKNVPTGWTFGLINPMVGIDRPDAPPDYSDGEDPNTPPPDDFGKDTFRFGLLKNSKHFHAVDSGDGSLSLRAGGQVVATFAASGNSLQLFRAGADDRYMVIRSDEDGGATIAAVDARTNPANGMAPVRIGGSGDNRLEIIPAGNDASAGNGVTLAVAARDSTAGLVLRTTGNDAGVYKDHVFKTGNGDETRPGLIGPVRVLDDVGNPVLRTYPVQGLPDPGNAAGAMVQLTNGAGGQRLACTLGDVWTFADGTPVTSLKAEMDVVPGSPGVVPAELRGHTGVTAAALGDRWLTGTVSDGVSTRARSRTAVQRRYGVEDTCVVQTNAPVQMLAFYGQSNAGAGGATRYSPPLGDDYKTSLLRMRGGAIHYGTTIYQPRALDANDLMYYSNPVTDVLVPATSTAVALEDWDRDAGRSARARIADTNWYGGRTIHSFRPGRTAWVNLVTAVAHARDLATLYDRPLYVPALFYVQGENSSIDYAALFARLVDETRWTLSALTQWTKLTVSAVTATTVSINTGDQSQLPAVDGMYVGYTITLDSGTAAGQTRTITGYTASTRTFTLGSAWATVPAVGTKFTLAPPAPKFIYLQTNANSNSETTNLDYQVSVATHYTEAKTRFSNGDTGVVLAGPMYHMPVDQANGIHSDLVGRQIAGEQLALAFEQAVTLGRAFHPLWPTALARANTAITVTFALPTDGASGTSGNLTFDTDWVGQYAPVANRGFVYTAKPTAGSGFVEPTITGVTIASATTVTITLSDKPGKTMPVTSATSQTVSSTGTSGLGTEDDVFTGYTVAIDSGTGAGQVRTVTAYNYQSDTFYLDSPWATMPDTTSVMRLVPPEYVRYAADTVSQVSGWTDRRGTLMSVSSKDSTWKTRTANATMPSKVRHYCVRFVERIASVS